jgi:hypothetical protein
MSVEGRPVHVLHNSGFGAPPETYRTTAVGTSLWLDLSCALAAFGTELGYRLHGDITRPVARRALHLALEQLGAPRATDDVRRLQGALLECLRERGRLVDWHAVARVVDASGSRKYGYHLGMKSQPDRFQLTLAAFSVVAPPVLLWWRPPSLDWWQGDKAINLRLLGGQGGDV